MPATQLLLALARFGHAWPQAPQFVRLVRRSTHVPGSVEVAPHTVSPTGQRQTPLVQVARVAQRLLQVPQCSSSVCRFDSQPFAAFMSQSANGALQTNVQVPLAQTAVAFAGGEQSTLQPPQWRRSVAVLTHSPTASRSGVVVLLQVVGASSGHAQRWPVAQKAPVGQQRLPQTRLSGQQNLSVPEVSSVRQV